MLRCILASAILFAASFPAAAIECLAPSQASAPFLVLGRVSSEVSGVQSDDIERLLRERLKSGGRYRVLLPDQYQYAIKSRLIDKCTVALSADVAIGMTNTDAGLAFGVRGLVTRSEFVAKVSVRLLTAGVTVDELSLTDKANTFVAGTAANKAFARLLENIAVTFESRRDAWASARIPGLDAQVVPDGKSSQPASFVYTSEKHVQFEGTLHAPNPNRNELELELDPAKSTALISAVLHYVVVNGTKVDSPAILAGLEPGDVITAVNGQKISDWNALTAKVQASPGNTLHLLVDRYVGPNQYGSRVQVDVTPQVTTTGGPGQIGVVRASSFTIRGEDARSILSSSCSIGSRCRVIGLINWRASLSTIATDGVVRTEATQLFKLTSAESAN